MNEQWDAYAYADKVREGQRLPELNAIRASLDSRTPKRPIVLLDPSSINLEDAPLVEVQVESETIELPPLAKKSKKVSSKPVQTAPWSQKVEASERKEMRRAKKAKRVKAVNGIIVREREEDGEGEMDWKEAIRETKERKRQEKNKSDSGKGKNSGMSAMVLDGM